MADNDDLFGDGGGEHHHQTQQNDVEVEDIDNQNVNEEDQKEEEERQKQKELRKKKKTAFVKRYLLEKQWFKEDQLKEQELKRKEQEKIKKRMQQFTNQDQLSILEKYEMQDKQDELFKPITKYKGPTSERFLTNKHCIYVWLFLNAFFVFTAIYVLNDGRPVRLSNGYDFRTEICGHGRYVDKPYLYYANPVLDIRVAFCIEKCPESSGPLICLYDNDGKQYENIYTKFCYVQMQGSVRSKYCQPNEPKNKAVVIAKLESFDITVKRYASDVNMSVDILACGCALTVILSFIFSLLIRRDDTVACFVVTVFLFTTLCFSGLAFLFYREYLIELEKNCFTLRDEKDCVGSRGYSYRSMAIVVIVFGGIYIALLMIMSKRLIKIIGFLKIASQVVEILQQIRWLPFQILGLAIAVASVTLINVPFGLSVADVQVVDSVDGAISGGKLKIMEFSGFAYFIAIYDFFIFIVWMLFLLGFRDLFISYCITLWFFTKRKDTVQIPKWVIFKNIARYHVGSIVMYSLISTCITFPKLIIMGVRKTLRSLPQYMNVVRYFQATCNCCLFSYEKFLRYFSKHSLVQVSITSKDFYPCSKIAYFLIFRNKDKISDMDQMQNFIVNNIKYCVAFMSGLFVYVILTFISITPFTDQKTEEIENKVIPGIVMFVFSFFFASIFLGSYDITCKSVIQCYLIDQEIFFGEKRYVEPFIKNEDLEKYKLQSKAGVILDEQKAQKKEEVSDDDKNYQSEEEDSEESEDDIKVKKNDKQKKDLNTNDNTIVSRNQSTTVFPKPAMENTNRTQFIPTTQTVKTNINTPSGVTNRTVIGKPDKEQQIIDLDRSDDDEDYNQTKIPNNSILNQNRLNTTGSNNNTPTLASNRNLANIVNHTNTYSPQNFSRANLENANNPGSNSRLNASQQQQNPSFFNYRDNTVTMPTKPSQYRIPTQNQITNQSYTQPMQRNPSQTSMLYQNTSMNQQRQYTAGQQPSLNLTKQSHANIFTNKDDDDDDNQDDYGLTQNVYATVQPTQNINLSRGQNRNEMRLLNASYASNARGNTGQSNKSKVSQASKASFDPFVQFEKHQINAESDEDDDD